MVARLSIAGVLLAVSVVMPASSQEPTGSVFGSVTLPERERLPSVLVVLEGIGASRSQVTDQRGEFRFVGLDPGGYVLRASLEGLAAVELPIDIRIARSTTVEVRMVPAIEDTIVVDSESPLLDQRRLARGTHVTRPELDGLPTARDPWAIVSQAPGVLVDRIAVGGTRGQQGLFGAMGARFEENDYRLDGVQITDMAGLGGSTTFYDFDWFEEVQVATGGSDVTKVSGGVTVNLATKRGTNQPRGTTRYLATDHALQSSPDFDPSDFPARQPPGTRTNRLDRLEDYGLEAGGPLLRDRVWAWGAAGRNDIAELATGGTPLSTRIESLAFKANGQLSAANSAVTSWNWNRKSVFGRGAGPLRSEETLWDQEGETDIVRLEDSHVLGSSAVVTAGYSMVDGAFGLFSRGGSGPDAPEPLLDADGVWRQNFATFESPRRSEEGRLESAVFLRSGQWSHELKMGGRLREWHDSNRNILPGRALTHNAGVNLGFPAGPVDVVIATRAGDNPTSERYRSLWLQDTLSSGRWTLNLGLRYDRQDGENDPSSVPANVAFPEVLPALEFPGNDGGGIDWKTLSPRLGATVAIGESRRTLVRTSFARYPEALGSADVLHVNPMSEASANFSFLDGNANNQWDGPHESTTFLFPSGFDPARPTALVSPNATDPELDPSVVDEAVLGIEHAVQPELVLALHLTARRTSEINERQPFVRDASEVRVARLEDYRFDRVLSGTLPEGDPWAAPTFALRPGLSLTGGSLLTSGDREVDYRGIAVSAVKRMSGRWMLRGFLNYAETEWRVPESFRAFDDPTNLHVSAIADDDGQEAMETHASFPGIFLNSRWQAQLAGLYRLAPERWWGCDLSANLYAREGYPLPYHARIVGSDRVARLVQAVERVDQVRGDDLATVDARLAKEISIMPGDRLGLTVSAEVFNLFNEATVLVRQSQLSSAQAGFVLETLSPRVWRLGLRIAWH